MRSSVARQPSNMTPVTHPAVEATAASASTSSVPMDDSARRASSPVNATSASATTPTAGGPGSAQMAVGMSWRLMSTTHAPSGR